MLKKISLFVLSCLIVFGVMACGSFTTTNQTSVTTTINQRPSLIDAVYDNLVETLPTEFSFDAFLPILTDEDY